MDTSSSLTKIAPALVKAIAAIKGATKDAKNPHFRNDYATLESVIDASREALSANDLCVFQALGEVIDGRLTCTTRVLHASGEWIQSVSHMRLMKDDPQGTGSTATYIRRYALMAALNVAPVDDDAEAAQGRQSAANGHSDAPTPEPKRADVKPPTLSERADRLASTLKAVKTPDELRRAYDLGAKLCADLDAKDPERLSEINALYEARMNELDKKVAA